MDKDDTGKRQNSDNLPNDSDIPEPFRIRCPIQGHAKYSRRLLEYNFRFLLPFSIILYIIFLVI